MTLFVVGMLAQAGAAVITWDTVGDTTGDSDVVVTGTVHAASTIGAQVTPITVNGITFSHDTALIQSTMNNGYTGDFDRIVPATGYSAAYGDLLSYGGYGSGDVLTIKQLTVGQEYFVQIWVEDDRFAGRTVTVDSSVTLDKRNTGGETGQWATGTFTADADTQVINLTGSHGGHANALSVQVIPEPATLGLIACFGGAILFIRRRFMI